ncbi:MAG: phosphoglycerate mutase [Patescibacteria group bacterium]|nr:MAG: phosphoglycerate mutase [Patescibacteria group bacterium]
MSTKRIYFVRHAESHMNAQGLLHQYEEGPLSDYGIEQAQALARRFQNISVDLIVSSPYERAKATSAVIMDVVQAPVEYSDLLKEFGGPKELEGKAKNDPEVIKINKIMTENRNDPHWRYSDEETAHELITRATKAVAMLEELNANAVICVTHGLFLRILVGVMMFGEKLDRDYLLKFMRFISISNTGVTVCEHQEERWKLITLNDMAHLN